MQGYITGAQFDEYKRQTDRELARLHEELQKAKEMLELSQQRLQIYKTKSDRLERAIVSHMDRLHRMGAELTAEKRLAEAEYNLSLRMLELGTHSA